MLTRATMRCAWFWKLDDGRLLLRQLLLHQRDNLLFPNRQRHLAPVPIGQAPDPFGEQDAVLAEAVGDGEGAAVGLAVLVFGQDAERAGADLFEGGGEGEDGRLRMRDCVSEAWRCCLARNIATRNATSLHRHAHRLAHRLPLAPAVLHLADALADVAGALGVGAQAARDIRVAQGFLDAEDDGLGGEEPFLGAHGLAEGVAAMLGGGGHDAEQGGPVHRAAAREVARVGVQQAQLVGGDQHEAGFVQAPAAGAAEHLQQLVGLEQLLGLVAAIGFAGEGDAAQGEVDAGGQAHGGDDDPELAGLGERLDDAGPGAVAQAAVMIGDAALEQLGQVFADDQLLLGAELEGIGRGQLPGEFVGHGFGGLAARGEDQDRPQVFGQRLGDEPGPVTADFAGDMVAQAVGMDLVERHGAFIVADQNGLAAKPLQPFDDILRIADAAAEQEQLRLRRRQGHGELVIQAAVEVAEHLVLVHDQQGGAVALDEAVLLRLQRGDQHGGAEVFRQVARGDADVPAARAPFGELVVGQRAGRHRVDGLPAILALVGPELEDQRLARPGRRLDDHVLALAQGADGLLLPEVGDRDLVEGGQLGQW